MGRFSILNFGVARYLDYVHARLQHAVGRMHHHQEAMLKSFVHKARKTEYGKEYHFSSIKSYADFTRQVPVVQYDQLRDQIQRMMTGETDILWPGLVTWFSKSSGTTSDKSKFIPVTTEHLNHTHTRAGWYSLSLLYKRHPDIRVFADKNLVLTGSISRTPHPDIRYGDVSAIMLHHMPWIGRPFFVPSMKTSLMAEWDKKIEIMARVCSRKEVGVFAGVPTWTLVLMQRILEMTGCDHMLEVWPNAKAYLHGGVGFDPYEDQFRQLFPSDQFIYQEIYNASEGYFSAQDLSDRKEGMLLFPDNGIVYELVPESQWFVDQPETIPLRDAEIDKPYALVITTNGGLWRYMIGDTVSFTSTNPYRFCVTGRTRHYINTFGEEVMVHNTDKAVALASAALDVKVSDYTVGPIHLTLSGKGGHHWLIEFEKMPKDVEAFADRLDHELQQVNGDYEAKRYQSMALERLKLTVVPKGTFRRWLDKKGKTGSQAKIPRLSNDRVILEEVLKMINHPFAPNQLV